MVLKSKKLDTTLKMPTVNQDGVKVESCTETQDVQAQSVIFGALESTVIQKIMSCETTAEI